EAQARYQGLSDSDFLAGVYTNAMDHAPTPAELAPYLALVAGNGRGAAALSMINAVADGAAGNALQDVATRDGFTVKVDLALSNLAATLANQARYLSEANTAVQALAAANPVEQHVDGALLGTTSTIQGGNNNLAVPAIMRDRWGNVLSVTDARDPNWKISYQYNYNNQLIDQTAYALSSSGAAHTSNTYDALGRLTATTDAMGNVNRYEYDAAGNMTREIHADDGIVSYTYDLFGDRKSVTTMRGAGQPDLRTNYAYDHLGHLLSSTSGVVDSYIARVEYGGDGLHTRNLLMSQLSGSLVQSYAYDELGRNVSRTDAANHTSTIAYDLDGNVILTRNEIGAQTLNSYDAFHNRIATQDANGNGMRWNVDSYGRVLSSTSKVAGTPASSDIVTYYGYDGAGRKISQTSDRSQSQTFNGLQDIRYVYTDGLLTEVRDAGTGVTTTYTYDQAGNRLSEKQSYASLNGAPARVQNNTMTYDRQNRLASVSDDVYTLRYEYDANGNRTHVHTEYAHDASDTAYQPIDSYNSYDRMNRQTVVNGDKLADGTVVYGAQGHAITYDQAGNRLTDTFIGKQIYNNSGTYGTRNGVTVESYSYDNAGRLSTIVRDGVLVNQRHYDQLGRVTESGILQGTAYNGLDIVADAVGSSSIRHIYAYGASGLLLEQRDERYNSNGGAGDLVQNIFFNDQEGRYDAAGNLLSYTVSPKDRGPWENYNYDVQYAYLDGQYKEASKFLLRSGTNISRYDVNGNRTSVVEQNTGKVLTTLWYNADGYVQSKIEDGGGQHFSLIVNGQVLGEETRTRDNILGSTYTGVSSPSLSAPPSTYSVQGASETLQSIAQNIWGDSKLWYLIADANALNSDSKLTAGQILNIPARVNTVHNDYATFKPYDAADALGSTDPTLPAPGHGGGCGAAGQLIMIVVAVAVTFLTSGAAIGLLGETMGMAAAAAAGSVASQVVVNAIGAQDGFSWKNVALAAVSAGVTEGVSQLSAPGGLLQSIGGSEWQAVAARAAISNTVSQGIGNIAGLQHGFSWTSVAASAAGAAVSSAVGNPAGTKIDSWDKFGTAATASFAGGLTTSVLRGGKIAVAQIATDAFGNALGSSLADSMRPTPAIPAKSFSDSIDRGPDWLQSWKAANPNGGAAAAAQAVAEQAIPQSAPTLSDLGEDEYILSDPNRPGQNFKPGSATMPKRSVPVFDMSNAGQSFSDGAAVPAPSTFGTEQRYKITDSSMRMVPNMDYVGPNGEANIVPASAPAATDSNFFGYTKQLLQDGAVEGAAWGDRRGGFVGGLAYHGFSAFGAATDILYPGSEQQAALDVAGGALIGRASPYVMGYLNSLPYLGDTIPQLSQRIFGPGANTVVPHGFGSLDEFTQFGTDMRVGLDRAGYGNAEPLLQGSAVTGKSFKTGQPFDLGRVSDFDVALADPSLLAKAEELGIGLRSSGTRTGPLTARDLRALGLRDLSNQMGQQTGRDVNFMIYNKPATAAQRAPSVILPGGK
ncbi:MAG: hypothetical protein V4641_20005, partial [Pseudomonadota bacterium]